MFLRESFEYTVRYQHMPDYQHYVAMSVSVFHDSLNAVRLHRNVKSAVSTRGNDNFQKGNKLFRRKAGRHFEK